jgi:type II secretory pathway pseudopilin PulG
MSVITQRSNRFHDQRGMSLVEATIILMVLSVLSAILAPSARDYLEDGRGIKAKADVETIGSAIDRLMRNTGSLCLSLSASTATPCDTSVTGRVELLVSGAAVNTNEPTVVTTAFTPPNASTTAFSPMNWAGDTNEVSDTRRDTMDRQFVTDAAGYAQVTFTSGGGPRTGVGWRGPYLNGPIDVDPWGYTYQASTVFLAVASNAAAGTGTGQKQGGWDRDVVVISAGSNGTIQTAFGSQSTTGVGDDVVYVVQGSTH